MGRGGRSLDVNLKDQDGVQILGHFQNLKATEVCKLIYPKAKIIPGNQVIYQLPNIPTIAIHFKAKSDNTGNIWIGGIGNKVAAIDFGIPLAAGDTYTIKPENANLVTLMGENDTDTVYCEMELPNSVEPTFTDEIPVPVDTVAPTVQSVSPTNGSSGQSRRPVIVATFSEAILASSVSASSFTISGGVIPTTTRYIDPNDATKVVMEFASDLSALQLMTVTLKGTGGSKISDLAGNTLAADFTWTFTTQSAGTGADVTPPTVSSTSPTNNATGVSRSTSPTITFNENMLGSTINTTNIKVIKVSGGSTVSSSVSLGVNQKTVTITAALEFSTLYQIVATTGVKDLAGNAMAAQFTSNFTTAAPSYNLIFTHADNGETSVMDNDTGGTIHECMRLGSGSAIIGHKVHKVIVKFRRAGSPSGTMRVRIRSSTNGTIQHTFTQTLSVSSITTSSSGASYSFESPTNNYTMAINNVISVEIDAPGSNSSNFIRIFRDGDGTDSTNSHTQTREDGTTDLTKSEDFACSVYEAT